jgi:hypothetical protein
LFWRERRITVCELNLTWAINEKKFEAMDNSGDSLKAGDKIFTELFT